jgi:hypothetical protein
MMRNAGRQMAHPDATQRKDVSPGLGDTRGKLSELLRVSRLTTSWMLRVPR